MTNHRLDESADQSGIQIDLSWTTFAIGLVLLLLVVIGSNETPSTVQQSGKVPSMLTLSYDPQPSWELRVRDADDHSSVFTGAKGRKDFPRWSLVSAIPQNAGQPAGTTASITWIANELDRGTSWQVQLRPRAPAFDASTLKALASGQQAFEDLIGDVAQAWEDFATSGTFAPDAIKKIEQYLEVRAKLAAWQQDWAALEAKWKADPTGHTNSHQILTARTAAIRKLAASMATHDYPKAGYWNALAKQPLRKAAELRKLLRKERRNKDRASWAQAHLECLRKARSSSPVTLTLAAPGTGGFVGKHAQISAAATTTPADKGWQTLGTLTVSPEAKVSFELTTTATWLDSLPATAPPAKAAPICETRIETAFERFESLYGRDVLPKIDRAVDYVHSCVGKNGDVAPANLDNKNYTGAAFPALALMALTLRGHRPDTGTDIDKTTERLLGFLLTDNEKAPRGRMYGTASTHENYHHGFALQALAATAATGHLKGKSKRRLLDGVHHAVDWANSNRAKRGGWAYKETSGETDSSVTVAIAKGMHQAIAILEDTKRCELAKQRFKTSADAVRALLTKTAKSHYYKYTHNNSTNQSFDRQAGCLLVDRLNGTDVEKKFAALFEKCLDKLPDASKFRRDYTRHYRLFYTSQLADECLKNSKREAWFKRALKVVLKGKQGTKGQLGGDVFCTSTAICILTTPLHRAIEGEIYK